MTDQNRVPSKSTKYRFKRKASTTVLMQGSSESDSSDFETPKRACLNQRLNIDDEFHLNNDDRDDPEPSCFDEDRSSNSSIAEISNDEHAGPSAGHDTRQPVEDWAGNESDHIDQVDPHLAQDVIADISSDVVNTSEATDDESVLGSDDELSDDEESMSEEHSGSDSSDFGDEPRNDNQRRREIFGDTPLYEGAPLTMTQSILAIMTLCLTHSLTGSCITDILALLALHCPLQNSCVRTMYKFQKIFTHVGRRILIRHYYCSGCYTLLANKDAVCPRCGEGYDKSFFIEIPLVTQLQTMFKRPGFVEKLQYRFNRVKHNGENIEDIYDGRIYKEQFDSGFLQNPYNISLMWYTDGVSIFKSSKFSIWPLYYMINELNYKDRVKKQNIILAGLWFGIAKPKVNTYFQPFHTVLQHFKNVGYVCEIPNGPPIRVRGILLCGTCDLPAKSAFMNFKQYNGFHGCARCKASGQRYNNEENCNVHVYPYTPNLILRSNEEVRVYAREAIDRGTDVYGVKGPSILYNMVPDMVRSTAIDKMHGLGGLSKLLTILWFDTTHSNMPFSLSQMLDVVDRRLQSLSPPSFVPRMPRKIKETLAFWKSLEFKLWLLYYSIPVLIGIMDEQYLQHHIKLVSAIYLLSQRSIFHEQINNASHLLYEYVRDFEQLYGLRHIGMNVHQILHLPEVVLDLGPLWVYCCFPWEDLNGKLIKFCHGSRHIGLQICSSASIFLNLVGMIDQLDPESPIRGYCEKLLQSGTDFKIAEIISDKIYAVGTFIKIDNAARGVRIILNHDHNIVGGNFQLFKRFRKNGVMYSSEAYTRSNKKTSTYVAFKIDGVPKLGNLKQLIRWSQCECAERCLCRPAQYFCLIEVYIQMPWLIHDMPHIKLSYMNKVQRSDITVAVPVSALECLCYHIVIEDDVYIIKPVNTLEAE